VAKKRIFTRVEPARGSYFVPFFLDDEAPDFGAVGFWYVVETVPPSI
jgi:hypothetical protein